MVTETTLDWNLLVYRLAQAEEHIEKQDVEMETLRNNLSEIKKQNEESITQIKLDAEKREKNRLLWGIGALGAVVSTMGTIIWQYRAMIFK